MLVVNLSMKNNFVTPRKFLKCGLYSDQVVVFCGPYITIVNIKNGHDNTHRLNILIGLPDLANAFDAAYLIKLRIMSVINYSNLIGEGIVCADLRF